MLRYVRHFLGLFLWRGRASVGEYLVVGLVCLGAALFEIVTWTDWPPNWPVLVALTIAYIAGSTLTRRAHDVNYQGVGPSVAVVGFLGVLGVAYALLVGKGDDAPGWAHVIASFTFYLLPAPLLYFHCLDDPVVEGNRFGPIPPWTSKAALRPRPLGDSARRLRRRIRAAHRPALRLRASVTPTRSWLGGGRDAALDIPPGLRFLARIDLGEAREAGGPDWLPPSGGLCFYSAQDGWDGPADWRVVHVEGSEAAPPTSAAFLSMTATRAYPSIDWLVALDDIEDEDLDAQVAWEDGHRVEGLCLGGYPAEIQDACLALECELALAGEDRSAHVVYPEPDTYKRAAASARRKWRLLLQLEQDRRLEVNLGDAGRLWFFVREADARRGDFSNVWVKMQSH